MGVLEFVAALVGHLAWPVSVIVLVSLLRGPLVELIPTLNRLRYKDLELTFGARAHQLANAAEQSLPAGEPEGPELGRLRDLALVSPRAAVIESWLRLEAAAGLALQARGAKLRRDDFRSPLGLGRALQGAQVLNGEELKVFDELRNLRNAATHGPEFALNPEAAVEYARAAIRLADVVKARASEVGVGS